MEATPYTSPDRSSWMEKGTSISWGKPDRVFPLINPLEPAAVGNGAMEVVVAELDPTGANLLFSTRIGSGGTPHRESSRAGSRLRRRHLSRRQYDRPGPDHDSRRIPDDLQR